LDCLVISKFEVSNFETIYCKMYFELIHLRLSMFIVESLCLSLLLGGNKATGMDWGMQVRTSTVTKLTKVSGKQRDFIKHRKKTWFEPMLLER